MPDAQIQIEKVWKSDPKEGDYGTYHKYDVQYAGGGKARYVTFKDDLGEKAQANVGRKVLVTYDEPKEQGHNPMLKAISDPLDDTVAPTANTNGAGNTRQPEAPETRAAIAASVALKEAVNFATGSTAFNANGLLSEVAEPFFDWLMSKSQAVSPEKPPQSVEEPSEEQRRRLAELVGKLETQAPKQQGQKSWRDDLDYWSNHELGKPAVELNTLEYEQLIDQAEWFVKDQALAF